VSVKYLIFALSAALFFTSSGIICGQGKSSVHELTIYVVPSHSALSWESPSSIYRSSLVSFIKARFSKYPNSVGHMFIEFSTPLIDSVVLTGIRSTSSMEKVRLLNKEKIGMGIMGAPMGGRMESSADLREMIDYLSAKKMKIAFIKYTLNEQSALRVKEFLETFLGKKEGKVNPGRHYGGAFWPRYENEGAGCSSFGLSALECAGVKIDTPGWKITVNIPASLVGGEYNNNRKVRRYKIDQAKKWHNGDGVEGVDYFEYNVYDPSLVYDWIINKRKNYNGSDPKNQIKGKDFHPGTINNIQGLTIDVSNISIPENEPVFLKRTKQSVFIDVYKKRISQQ
jgi:hypothetical protein